MIRQSDAFTVGDRVTWNSQSAGYQKKKAGVVVAVVPPRCRVNDCIPCGFVLKSIPGSPRQHESYLVRVGTTASLYWPRVALLYRQPQPTLTDAEREALQRVLRLLRERYYGTGRIKDAEQIGAVIDGLLARDGGDA
jgi:hypothetical protein